MEKDFNPNTAGMFTLANHLYVYGWTKWNTRATRREFWLGGLGVFIYALPLIVPYIYSMDFDVYASELEENPFAMFTPLTWVLMVILNLVFFVPEIGAVVRRLHDTGRSGWWYLVLQLLSLLPLVNIIACITLLVFWCSDSDKKPNKWGVSPKYGAPLPSVPGTRV